MGIEVFEGLNPKPRGGAGQGLRASGLCDVGSEREKS